MALHSTEWPRRLCHFVTLSTGLLIAYNAYSEPIEPELHCAKTPTYRYFEDIQYDAYTKTNLFYYDLLKEVRDQQKFIDDIKMVREELARRRNSLSTPGRPTNDRGEEVIQQWIKDFPLPTCYENPLIYYLLMNYKGQIDKAKSALSYINNDEINLGTLPTADINAHTYPANGGLANILAFNVQLFMFDYQLTKMLIPTVNLRQSNGGINIGVNSASAIDALKHDPNLSINFTMALLEFLGLTTPSTRALDQAYDPLIIHFTEGMELFAVAHEYGHVLKKHSSPIIATPLGLNANGQPIGGRTVLAYARSWKQELEADQVGIALVLQALSTYAKDDDASRLSWLYSVKGALFFFRCLDIVDQARYIMEHGVKPPVPSFADRVFLRAFADGKTSSEENDAHKELTIGSYPPAWLRLERVEQAIEERISAQPPSADSRDFSEIADALIGNAPIVWHAVETRFPVLIDLVRLQNGGRLTDEELIKGKAKTDAIPISYDAEQFLPGCYVRANSWISTFLCSSDLQSALVTFEAGQNDEAVIAAYRAAVSRDWLLLSGAQDGWARTALASDTSELRKHALSIFALTGDKGSLEILRAVDTRSWSDADRSMLARAEQFLELHGRDVSLPRLATLAPQVFSIPQFLSFPGDPTELLKLVPKSPSRQLHQFFKQYSSVSNKGSLSGFALALAYENSRGGDVAGLLADLLHAVSLDDAALQYAEYGVSAGGNLASLENTIGNILTSKHDYANANIHYSASLAAGRSDGWPELNMANNLDKLGKLDDAEEMYRRALSRRNSARSYEEYAEYLNDTAWFLVTRRASDHSKLEEAYKFSLQSNVLTARKDSNFLDTLAECQLKLGDKAGAIETWKAALAVLPPDNVEQRKTIEGRLKTPALEDKR